MLDTRFKGAPRLGKTRARVPVVRVVSTEVQSFTIYSKSIYGQLVHWWKGRSAECCADTSRCPRCADAQPIKWKGYIFCHHWQKKEDVFLEITEAAADALARQAPVGMPLRGLVLRVSKTKGGAKGRYLVEVMERRVQESELKPDQDPKEVLLFLWNCKNQPVVE